MKSYWLEFLIKSGYSVSNRWCITINHTKKVSLWRLCSVVFLTQNFTATSRLLHGYFTAASGTFTVKMSHRCPIELCLFKDSTPVHNHSHGNKGHKFWDKNPSRLSTNRICDLSVTFLWPLARKCPETCDLYSHGIPANLKSDRQIKPTHFVKKKKTKKEFS